MKRYICSDLHLGHHNVHNFRDGFSSAEEHHELVFNNLKEIQGKRTYLILLGDIAFTKDWLNRVGELKFGRTVLILGNHDNEKKKKILIKDIANTYDEVYSLKSYKNCWLTHCPIHPTEIRTKDLVIHGHTHPYLILDRRYRNVCLEYTDYKPIPWEEAISEEYYERCRNKLGI